MKTLFFVGRAYPHIKSLEYLKHAGLQLGLLEDSRFKTKHPHVFDHLITSDFSSQNGFVTMLSHSNLPTIDGLLCTYENYIPFKSLAAEILSLPSISHEAATASTDKYKMRKKFLDYDESITPQFALIESKDQLLQFAQSATFPLVMKPTSLVKSLLVHVCNDETELLAAYDMTLMNITSLYEKNGITDREPAIIVEEFIQGSLCSVAAFVDKEGQAHLCDGIVELTPARSKGFDDTFLYSRVLSDTMPEETCELVKSVARKGIVALGMMSSPAHVEIIYGPKGAKIVEIGARIGGYRQFLYQQSYGIDMLAQEVNLALGTVPSVDEPFVRNSAMFELFPQDNGVFQYIDGDIDTASYDYFHQIAQIGTTIGAAKDGYRATAIIGIADQDSASFKNRISVIDSLKVVTS